jgi:hypothetical protein
LRRSLRAEPPAQAARAQDDPVGLEPQSTQSERHELGRLPPMVAGTTRSCARARRSISISRFDQSAAISRQSKTLNVKP